MADPQPPPLPVILELAPLPRDQAGPFVLLGVKKTAGAKQIEANWAKRLIWARKKQISVPLEDINWAKEVLLDADRRVLADACSLNLDTMDGVLEQLENRSEGAATPAALEPLDEEKDLSAYRPAVEVPDLAELHDAIDIPEIPRDFPIVRHLLKESVAEEMDPWELGFAVSEQHISPKQIAGDDADRA